MDWLIASPLSEPLYKAIADRIGAAIQTGRIGAGDRLPPQRSVAQLLSVDLTTVTRGYREAEARGLIEGQIGRGTFVKTRTPMLLADLTLNLPPRAPAALIGEASQVASNILRARRDSVLDYTEPDEAAYRAAAAWLTRLRAPAVEGRIVITGGAQHALGVLLAVFRSRRRPILAEELTYPGFLAAARLLGINLIPIKIDREGADPDSLLREARRHKASAAYLLPTLQNPTAVVMSERRRDEIAEVARKTGITVIEDDVYGALLPRQPDSIARRLPDQTVFIGSLSKAVAPGLRTAYLHAPSRGLAAEINAAIRALSWSVSPILWATATSWIETGIAERLLEARREEAQKRSQLALSILGDHLAGHHRYSYHGWMKVRGGWRIGEFVDAARQRGVVVTPASSFSVTARELGAVRVCFGAAESLDALRTALSSLRELLDDGRPNLPGIL